MGIDPVVMGTVIGQAFVVIAAHYSAYSSLREKSNATQALVKEVSCKLDVIDRDYGKRLTILEERMRKLLKKTEKG